MADAPLLFQTGPFTIRVRTTIGPLRERLDWCYGPVRLPAADRLIQFNVAVDRGKGPRRWVAPQAVFRFEARTPFEPYPLDHAFPLLEWGLNWCIGGRANQYLMLHAGVVERDGRALLLPAVPGSGKTTLTVALCGRGWRFLSDEFALIDLADGRVWPLPRSAPLKNAAIDVIRSFAPALELGPVFPRTRKGDVAHLRPPREALARQQEAAVPAWVVFPRWQAGAPARLHPVPRSEAFTRLAHNSFNYRLLGAIGFHALSGLIARCNAFSAVYGDLDAIIAAIDRQAVPATP